MDSSAAAEGATAEGSTGASTGARGSPGESSTEVCASDDAVVGDLHADLRHDIDEDTDADL